jgi:hypothetical protein
MMKPVYISSASAISPQNSFAPENFLKDIQTTRSGKLFVVEPDYRQYINPVAVRRMSRLIKMGISCGMKALQDAGVDMPDAIITGTGLGSMTDTEKFLKDMISLQGETLNPTFFIQSTYNSVNGWISLQTKATGYNQTYVNRGFSLEMALTDAQLFLNETDELQYVLAGGFDELTDEYFLVKSKVGYWKEDVPESINLLEHNDSTGTIAGEGASFFVLSNDPVNAICSIREIKMLQSPTAQNLNQTIERLLSSHNISKGDVHAIICGINGDSRYDSLYADTLSGFPADTSVACFKHLTGEYPTATGFAVWLAIKLFSDQHVPVEVLYRKGESTGIRNILVINHYILGTASAILLRKE